MDKKIKKLSLSKLSIAQLSDEMARQIKGGFDDGYDDDGKTTTTSAPLTTTTKTTPGCDILTH